MPSSGSLQRGLSVKRMLGLGGLNQREGDWRAHAREFGARGEFLEAT